jgi:predicted transcriptional regulator
MREIINQPQSAMLAVLENGDTDKSSLIKLSGIFKHRFMHDMPDLRERGLVESYTLGTKSALMYAITHDGKRALADYIKHQEMLARMPEKALPPRRNLFEFAVWVPPKNTYVRNNGNVHIPSRGV